MGEVGAGPAQVRTRVPAPLACAWAVVVLVVSTSADWNADARLLVGAAITLSIGTALASAAASQAGRSRLAAGLLLVSAVVAPTSGIYPVNLALAAFAVWALARSSG